MTVTRPVQPSRGLRTFLFFFLSWVANTRLNHSDKCCGKSLSACGTVHVNVSFKVGLGISRTNADSPWNPVYNAFHQNFVVETKRFVGSFVHVILTWQTCGQCSSKAAESKRRALGNYFFERICYMFLMSRCRRDSDLGLCTTLGLAFGEPQRNDKIWFFLRRNTFFFRKSPLRLTIVLGLTNSKAQRLVLGLTNSDRQVSRVWEWIRKKFLDWYKYRQHSRVKSKKILRVHLDRPYCVFGWNFDNDPCILEKLWSRACNFSNKNEDGPYVGHVT